MKNFLIIYFASINLYAVIIFFIDKQLSQSKRKRRRVPEAHFLTLAIMGASLGIHIAMYVFHHKTKHAKFKYGIPFIILLQISAIYFYVTEIA